MRFGLVDYGSGNLRSVAKAIDAVGGRVRNLRLALRPGTRGRARAAGRRARSAIAWRNCANANSGSPSPTWLREGRPFLGICLGYQLLFEASEESPGAAGFGHFAGMVRRLRGEAVKVPHIGWNTITPRQPDAPALAGTAGAAAFLFCALLRAGARGPGHRRGGLRLWRRIRRRGDRAGAVAGHAISSREKPAGGPDAAAQFHFIDRHPGFDLTTTREFPSMLLLPAIDLMSGEVVRLRQGRADEKTVFPGSPGGMGRSLGTRGRRLAARGRPRRGVSRGIRQSRRRARDRRRGEDSGGARRGHARRGPHPARLGRGREPRRHWHARGGVARFCARDGPALRRRTHRRGDRREGRTRRGERLDADLGAQGARSGARRRRAGCRRHRVHRHRDRRHDDGTELSRRWTNCSAGVDCAVIASGGVSSAADLVELARREQLARNHHRPGAL